MIFLKKICLKPRFAILVESHCENFFNLSEEDRTIKPAVKFLKKEN